MSGEHTLSFQQHRLINFRLDIKHDNINNFCYAFNINKNAKLYFLSTDQASDIELLSPKIET